MFQQNAVCCLSHRLLVVCAIWHVTLSAVTQIFLLALPDSRSQLTPLIALEPGDTNNGLHTHFLVHICLLIHKYAYGTSSALRHISITAHHQHYDTISITAHHQHYDTSSALRHAVQCAQRKR
jgi:hypothetical protein